MKKELFQNEHSYQAAMAVAKDMLEKGLISEDDFQQIEAAFAAKYRPIFRPFIA